MAVHSPCSVNQWDAMVYIDGWRHAISTCKYIHKIFHLNIYYS